MYLVILLGARFIYACAFLDHTETNELQTRFYYCILAGCLTGVLMSFIAIRNSERQFKQDINSVNKAHNNSHIAFWFGFAFELETEIATNL